MEASFLLQTDQIALVNQADEDLSNILNFQTNSMEFMDFFLIFWLFFVHLKILETLFLPNLFIVFLIF